jgi:hypothetical protein
MDDEDPCVAVAIAVIGMIFVFIIIAALCGGGGIF